MLVEGTIAEDTPGRECPRDDRDWRPRAGVTRTAGVSVGGSGAGSLWGGGTLSVEGPQSVPSWISVVRVDGTIAEDTPGRECPRDDRDWRPRAGVTRTAGVSVGGSGAGSLWGGGTLPSLDLAGSLLPGVPAEDPPQGVL